MANYSKHVSQATYDFRIAYAAPNERGGIDLVVQSAGLPKPYSWSIKPEQSRKFRERLGVKKTRSLRGKFIRGVIEDSKLISLFNLWLA